MPSAAQSLASFGPPRRPATTIGGWHSRHPYFTDAQTESPSGEFISPSVPWQSPALNPESLALPASHRTASFNYSRQQGVVPILQGRKVEAREVRGTWRSHANEPVVELGLGAWIHRPTWDHPRALGLRHVFRDLRHFQAKSLPQGVDKSPASQARTLAVAENSALSLPQGPTWKIRVPLAGMRCSRHASRPSGWGNACRFLGRAVGGGVTDCVSRQRDLQDGFYAAPEPCFSKAQISRAVGWQAERKLIGAK